MTFWSGRRGVASELLEPLRGLRNWWRRREHLPASVRVTPQAEASPAVPAAYMPLYTYLDRRYAGTVVLTFEQIEALLGFTLPASARTDREWWTVVVGSQHHCAAWTGAGRTAAPNLAAGVITFERRV